MDLSYWTKRRKINARVSAHLTHVKEGLESTLIPNIENQPSENENDEVHASTSDINSVEAGHWDDSELESSSSEGTSPEGAATARCSTEHETFVQDSDHHSNDSDIEPETFDCDSEITDNSDAKLAANLADWASTFRITHSALQQLLLILQTFFPNLPNDARTLLKTARQYDIRTISDGLYHHFGIAKGLARYTTTDILRQATDLNCIHIQINIDGLPLFKSSKAQFWPILGRVVKPLVSDPFIIGLFSGEKKPGDVGEYLQDFIGEVHYIEQHGIAVDGSENKFGINLSCFICDAPARAFIKNIKGHNAYHGCDKCIQNGVWEGKVTFPEIDSPLRTDADFDEMKDENHHLRGTLSPLCNLSLGMILQFPRDPMHLVYLGVMKRLMWSWMKGPVVNRCRIGAHNISQISECILSCHKYLPREFPRKCRSLSEVDRWKATEFRQFILYSGAVVVKGKLSDSLCSPLHYATHCEYAHSVLCMFVEQWGKLYGKDMLVYNVHGLTHLAADAMRFGPLDTFSAFPFESFLGKIKQMLRKPQFPLSQVIRRLSEMHNVLKVDTKLKKCSLKEEHTLGPLPFEFRQYTVFRNSL